VVKSLVFITPEKQLRKRNYSLVAMEELVSIFSVNNDQPVISVDMGHAVSSLNVFQLRILRSTRGLFNVRGSCSSRNCTGTANRA